MVVWACIKPAGLIIDEGELATTDEAHPSYGGEDREKAIKVIGSRAPRFALGGGH